MLLYPTSCRDASTGNPEREIRLLAFAGGGRGGGGGGGGAPRETPREGGGGGGGGGDRAVDDTSSKTKQNIEKALAERVNESERLVKRYADLEKKMREQWESADAILGKERSDKTIAEFARKHPKEWQDLRHDRVWLQSQHLVVRGLKKRAEMLQQWERGEINPHDLVDTIEEENETLQREDPFKDEERDVREMKAGRVDSARSFLQSTAASPRGGDGESMPNASSRELWDNLGVSGKTQIMTELSARLNTNEMRGELNSIADVYEASLTTSTFPQILANASKKPEDPKDEANLTPAPVSRGGGLEWFTLTQLYLGFKDWKEAWIHAWEHQDQYKGSIFAKKVGRLMKNIVPYGETAQEQLDQTLEKKQNDEIGGVLDKLKRQSPTFKQVFGPGGLLHHASHHPTTALGVLKYAAGRGWLYKINDKVDKANRTIYGYKFDHLVPATWDDDQVIRAWDSLTRENSIGESEEQKKGKEKVEKFTDADQFIRAFEKDMKGCNFWSAMGIADAFIGRGKMGEASARLATVYLRFLREDDNVRNFISDAISERMPFPVWHRGYFTLAHITMDRGKIREWLSKNDKDIGNAGTLGGAIKKIEAYVQQRSGGVDKATMDDLVAKILAGQTPKAPGTGVPLSIFGVPGLEEYRNSPPLYEYFKDHDIGKDSIDYYTSESEIMLASNTFMTQLFAVNTSATDFVHSQKVQAFTGQAVYRYEDLRDSGAAQEAEVFRNEMRSKLKTGLEKLATGSNPLPLTSIQWHWGKFNGPVLATLLHYGFMDRETLAMFTHEPTRKALIDQERRMGTGRLIPANAPPPKTNEPPAAGGGHH